MIINKLLEVDVAVCRRFEFMAKSIGCADATAGRGLDLMTAQISFYCVQFN